MLKLTLALLALFVPAALAYTCSNTPVTVKNQGVPYYFPSQGSDEHYIDNLNCSWIIPIPDGYYVQWGFHANLGNKDGGSDDVETAVVYGDIEAWSFWFGNGWDTQTATLSDQLKINLKTHNDTMGTFRFNVTWVKQVPPMTPVVTVMPDFNYTIMNLWDLNTQNTATFTIASDAHVSLSTSCIDITDLSDVWVYDGTAVVPGGVHKNLEDTIFYDEDSTSSSLTIYNPINNAPLDSCIVLAQDDRNFQLFDQYSVFYDPKNNNYRDGLFVQAGNKRPYAITYYSPDGQPITLYAITYQNGQTGNVMGFNGVINPNNINTPDVTFTPDTLSTQLPYKFTSSVVTFMMNSGQAIFDARPVAMPLKNTGVKIETSANTETVQYPDGRRVVKMRMSNL